MAGGQGPRNFGHAGSTSAGSRAQARLLRCVVTCVLLMCVATATSASDVSVSVQHRDGVYEVRGRFVTPARLATVWEVLTDYEGIPSFVEAVKHSDIEQRAGARVRVRQSAAVGVFPVRKRARVTLDVMERHPNRIEFRDLLGQDFRLYTGAWSLSGDSSRTVVDYALDTTPRSAAPHWLGKSMMSHSAQDLLKQVRDEIDRRSRAR